MEVREDPHQITKNQHNKIATYHIFDPIWPEPDGIFCMTNYCSIGKFVASFGTEGQLVLKHHLGKKTNLKGLEVLFIEKNKDELIPYFIQSTRIKSESEIFITLEEIKTRELAQGFVQKQVWLTEEEFHKHTGKSAPISLLGYHIINDNQDLGEILEVIEQPHQMLCRIDLEGNEALIPIHQDTLVKIDKKQRQLVVVLPEGLLDVFR